MPGAQRVDQLLRFAVVTLGSSRGCAAVRFANAGGTQARAALAIEPIRSDPAIWPCR